MKAKKTKKISPATPRRRNPDATREQILEAARKILAEDGAEGLKVSKVAHLAGVNRGTAYQHFQTREELAKATAESVGRQLSDAMFGSETDDENASGDKPAIDYIERLARYAVENPELARIWLFETLNAKDPAEDEFFKLFRDSLEKLKNSEVGQDRVDTEALSVILLAGYFLWPVWVQAHAQNQKERDRMAHRFAKEVARLCMYGVIKPESYPQLVSMLKKK